MKNHPHLPHRARGAACWAVVRTELYLQADLQLSGSTSLAYCYNLKILYLSNVVSF
jgi:hypothetical protein